LVLKTLQVLYFDTLLQVLILNVLRLQEVLQNGAFIVSIDSARDTPERKIAGKMPAQHGYEHSVSCF
jgi:hypothetical protein